MFSPHDVVLANKRNLIHMHPSRLLVLEARNEAFIIIHASAIPSITSCRLTFVRLDANALTKDCKYLRCFYLSKHLSGGLLDFLTAQVYDSCILIPEALSLVLLSFNSLTAKSYREVS